MELVRKTSLQNTDKEVKETLDWKLDQLKVKNLPIESGLADYIAFGMQGIESDIEQLTNYKALIEAQIKQAKENQGKVKIECAYWLQGQGLDKLNGLNVSSITITKASEVTIKEKEYHAYYYENETHFKDHILEQLIKDGVIKIEKIVEKVEVPAKLAQIKVNKKRK